VSVAVSLTVILAFIWLLMRPALGEDLAKYFTTKVEMKQHTGEVMSRLDTMQHEQRDSKTDFNGLRTQVNLSSAFQMERGFKDIMNEHDAIKPTPTTAKWRADKREIDDKLVLVSQYKSCVLAEGKNCHLLQRQLLQ
jgi:hypothetical protein